MRRTKIAFLSPPGGLTRSTWSGIPYYMRCALQEHCADVVEIAPDRSARELVGKGWDRLSRQLRGRGRVYTHTLSLSRKWGSTLARRIPKDADVIFAPAGSTQIAFLEVDIPIVYTSDTTFDLIAGYYPEFSGLSSEYIEWGNEIEQRALDRTDLVLYPSAWAANSARQTYGIEEEKIRVFPYGANLDRVPTSEGLYESKSSGSHLLLFFGVDWERKGGPLAYETVAELRESGVDARLVVVGCTPPEHFRAPWVSVHSRIDKGDAAGASQLCSLLTRANFLLLPTRRECFGIVFCEASAYGTPSIATDTGGVSGVVQNGMNGYLLPEHAGARDYAELLTGLLQDDERYRSLVSTSRQAFETRLNWRAWALRVKELLPTLHSAAPSQARGRWDETPNGDDVCNR